MYSKTGIALDLSDPLPYIITYLSRSPYFGISIGSIAYKRLAASA